MTEPDVAITDYLLCIESFWLAVLLWKSKSRNPTLRFWYSFVFFALTLPPFIGGTVHGFFNEHGSRGNHVLWPATLISLALAALALWGATLHTVFQGKLARNLTALAAVECLAYCLAVLNGLRDFLFAIVNYIPSTLFLLITFLLSYQRRPSKKILWGVAGVLFTFLAAAVQVFKISLHPRYFNFNSLYHLIQGAALYLIYVGARELTE